MHTTMPSTTGHSRDSAADDQQRGLLVVFSGPSGVGKTTIAREILTRLNGVFSVSATTRAKGPGEVEGRDYYFVSDDEFARMRQREEFLECANVFGRHWYGTPIRPVREHLDAGRLVLLDIDVQGGRQVRRAMPEAYMVFIMPPSDEELLRRLKARGRDDPSSIDRRFAEAKREMQAARESGAYDAIIINDELEETIETACRLINEHRAHRRAG